MGSKANVHSRIFTALLICFVLAMPLNNCFEVAAMMNGTLVSSDPDVPAWSVTLTPIYLKAIKDLFLAATVLLLLAGWLKSPGRGRVFFTRHFTLLNLFFVLLLLSALYSLTTMPATIVLMGVRGYWSIVLVYAGALFCDLNEGKLYPYIVVIFVLHFLFQIMQWVTDVGFLVYATHNRCPGLFLIASSSGAFALLVHYFSIRFNSLILKSLSFLSIVLSNSTAGLLIIVLFYIFVFRNKFKPKVLFYPIYSVIVVAVGYWFLAHLGEVTGRGTGASSSALARLGILYLALTNWRNLVFGLGMGIATSQALISGFSGAIIADNTYIGILYNAGILPALMMLVFVYRSFQYFENKLLSLTLLGYSMTTVIFELNPVIQIILILLGVHIGRKYAATSIRVGGPSPRDILRPQLSPTPAKATGEPEASLGYDHPCAPVVPSPVERQ